MTRGRQIERGIVARAPEFVDPGRNVVTALGLVAEVEVDQPGDLAVHEIAGVDVAVHDRVRQTGCEPRQPRGRTGNGGDERIPVEPRAQLAVAGEPDETLAKLTEGTDAPRRARPARHVHVADRAVKARDGASRAGAGKRIAAPSLAFDVREHGTEGAPVLQQRSSVRTAHGAFTSCMACAACSITSCSKSTARRVTCSRP